MQYGIINVPVCRGIVTAEVSHDKACVHFVMEEACKKCNGFVGIDIGLVGPVGVVFFDPSKIICGKVGHGLLKL